MKVLYQDNLGNTSQYFKKYLAYTGEAALLQNTSEIAKALNQFKPNLLILKSEIIDNTVKAYCKKNEAKIISYGKPNNNADINIVINEYLGAANSYPDAPKPQLDILKFKDNCKKTDISVFIGRDKEIFLANFLDKNYNVKIYGNVKIQSPRYLGMITDQDKYEILNKSKIIIDLGAYHFHDAILLDTYPLIYTSMDVPHYFNKFDNLVSLTSQMEFLTDKENRSMLDSNMIHLKNQCYKYNDLSFVISVLKSLNFKEESTILENILYDILGSIA